MVMTHKHAKINVKGQLVQKTRVEKTDGRWYKTRGGTAGPLTSLYPDSNLKPQPYSPAVPLFVLCH